MNDLPIDEVDTRSMRFQYGGGRVKMKQWTGTIRIGSPRRIRHGDSLTVLGLRLIFVKPGRECETRDREATVEIFGRAPEMAARVASKLRAFGVDARRRGREVRLKRDPIAIYAREVRLPIIRTPQAYYSVETVPGPIASRKKRGPEREEKTS